MGQLEADGQARAIALLTTLLAGDAEAMYATRQAITAEIRDDRAAVTNLLAGCLELAIEALTCLGIALEQTPLELLQQVAPRLIEQASDPGTLLESEQHPRWP